MTAKPRPAPKTHYLPGNKRVWTPPYVIYLDTETTVIAGTDPEVLALALWCARLEDRKDDKHGQRAIANGSGTMADELATWIGEQVRGRNTVWLYAHNLGFDLATTRLPLVLSADGWTVTDAAVSGKSPWMRLSKGSCHLTLVDSHSWLGHPLEDIGEAVGIKKRPLPQDSTDMAGMLKRCRGDVKILAAAMGQLMNWWDDNELGNWTLSGAGCGWNAMRHIRPPVRPVINPDERGVAADRLAIHGGRRGAWVIGTRTQGPFIELDFRNAYPTVAANLALPARRMAPFTSMALDNWRVNDERWGIIADVELCTEVPRWPVRSGGATFCPTGTFRAQLAGPEIRDAIRLGCLMSIGAGYVHQLAPHLQPWAEWCLGVANSHSRDVPRVARLAAKGWSRSVIGKWATHGYTKLELGPSPTESWGYQEGWDHDTQSRGATIDIAGQRWFTYQAGEAEQAYPAVLAWVESETRVRLSRVIEAIGEGAILQCDTDGLIASERLIGARGSGGWCWTKNIPAGPARTKWVLDQLDPITAPLVMRVKATHDTVKILGPQHVQTPDSRSFSGLPRLAQEATEHNALDCPDRTHCVRPGHFDVVPDVYTYQSWPGLAAQMSLGEVRGYVRPAVRVSVRGPYAPGWVTTRGTVVPVEAAIGRDGATRLLPWQDMTRKPAGARLADTQHPALKDLW